MISLDAAVAIHNLFGLYADEVYRYAYTILRNAEEAEDAVQDVFMKVLRSWGQFEGRSDPKTWILSITRNHLYDRLRKTKTRKHILNRVVSEVKHQNATAPAPDVGMEDILVGLKDSYKQALILRYVNDLDTKEIAEVLQWSHAKVRTTLHRAIVTLRTQYKVSPSSIQRDLQEAGEFCET